MKVNFWSLKEKKIIVIQCSLGISEFAINDNKTEDRLCLWNKGINLHFDEKSINRNQMKTVWVGVYPVKVPSGTNNRIKFYCVYIEFDLPFDCHQQSGSIHLSICMSIW